MFVVRKLPKHYFFEIFNSGGFVLEFETKIFPIGYQSLIRKLHEEFHLPMDCRNDMPPQVEGNFQLLLENYLEPEI